MSFCSARKGRSQKGGFGTPKNVRLQRQDWAAERFRLSDETRNIGDESKAVVTSSRQRHRTVDSLTNGATRKSCSAGRVSCTLHRLYFSGAFTRPASDMTGSRHASRPAQASSFQACSVPAAMHTSSDQKFMCSPPVHY